jgi:hypothetical protein
MGIASRPAPTLAGVDLEALSTEELEEGICGFAARLAAATCVFVLAIAEYDRRRAWETWECRSMAHWLSWKCAMGPVAAREHVRVGAALGGLDLVRERFSTGTLSYSQVRAITRVATVATQADLVDLARAMTAAQLETVVRAYRRARPDVTDPDRAPVARRTLTCYTDDDGSLVGTFRLGPEDGAVLLTALSAASECRRAKESEAACGDGEEADDPTLDPAGAARADALVDLATAYLRQAEAGDTEGEEHRSAGAADRYVVNIIAEQQVLAGNPGERPDGVCQIEHGPGLAAETVRRLACEAPSVTIVEDQFGHVLDVGRRTRRISRALRRALARRDGGCQFPGCTTRTTQAHHVEHWIDGGPTRLNNLIELCSRHHHRHHEGGFGIAPGNPGGWVFTRSDGRIIPPTATPPSHQVGPDPGVEPSVSTCTPDWEGGTITDLGGIVDGLLRTEGLLVEPPPPSPCPDLEASLGWVTVAHLDTAPGGAGAPGCSPSPWRDPWNDTATWPGE